MFRGVSLEAQTPLYFLPKDIGIKVAAFADAGTFGTIKARRVGSNRRNTQRRPRWCWKGPLFSRCRPDLGFAARTATLRSGLPDYKILRDCVG